MSTSTRFKTITCKELNDLAKAGSVELIEVG